MLFYSYCPECGCESDPFRIEPEDGTPMVCPRCKLEYPYKTRHWMAQRILIRIFLLLFVLIWGIKGCVDGCEKKRAAERASLEAPVLKGVLDHYEAIDMQYGFGNKDFTWGSRPKGNFRVQKMELTGRCGWNRVKFFYGEKGLEAFTLFADDVSEEDGVETLHQTFRALRRCFVAKSLVELRKGNSFSCVYLPNDVYDLVLERDEKEDGKIADVRLKIRNVKLSGEVVDHVTNLKKCGWFEE